MVAPHLSKQGNTSLHGIEGLHLKKRRGGRFVAMFGYPGNPETNILQPENSPNKKEKQSFSGAMLPKNQLYME